MSARLAAIAALSASSSSEKSWILVGLNGDLSRNVGLCCSEGNVFVRCIGGRMGGSKGELDRGSGIELNDFERFPTIFTGDGRSSSRSRSMIFDMFRLPIGFGI